MITSCGFYNLHIAPLSQLVLADSHTINADGGKGAIMYLKAVLDIAAFNIGAFTARLIMIDGPVLDRCQRAGTGAGDRCGVEVAPQRTRSISDFSSRSMHGLFQIDFVVFGVVPFRSELSGAAVTMGLNMQDCGYACALQGNSNVRQLFPRPLF